MLNFSSKLSKNLTFWLLINEEINIVFHTTSLQFSIFQLLKYNGLEVFLEK